MVVGNDNCVRVAVRIRPQGSREKAEQSRVCTSVIPGIPQVTIGEDRSFTYDYVFDQQTAQPTIYESCVKELVEGTFDGYNATVLAYGQTGSGKTFTMGTSFESSLPTSLLSTDNKIGIIPRAAKHIFSGIEQRKLEAKEKGLVEPVFEILVQFIELYNEEIIDLLGTEERQNNNIGIREDPIKGEIYLKGVANTPISSAEDLLVALKNGAMNRTTASTNMNQSSSRSHAIFSVLVKQQRMVSVESDDRENMGLDGQSAPATELEVLTAKFHFVDLAGSERLKRTGATGDRQKEGISINCGLLALGNVISALGGASGRVMHVPYRDSKLTRLLQDSLGGNSRTLMIACASPSDVDFVETLNTLNYANRAKNIKNKVVANQDKSSKMISELRGRIAVLEAELNEYKQGKKLTGEDGQEIVNDQYLENVSLQHENNRLRIRIKALDETIDILKTRSIQLQQNLEMNNLEGCHENTSPTSENGPSITSTIRGYIEELESLRVQLIEARSTNDELRKQNQRYRSHVDAAGPTSPYLSTVIAADNTSSLIKAAKKEIRQQKKLAALQQVNGEEANNMIEAEDEDDEEALLDNEDELEREQEDEEDALDLVHSQEREQLCSDLANLQEDISIKEMLVAEIQQKDRRLKQMQQDYERKMIELTERISNIAAERDKIIADITSKAGGKQSEEKIRQVKEDYEKKIGSLKVEFKKYKSIEKEHQRMQMQQNRQMQDMQRIQNEILEMKRNKVELMRKLKEENKKAREAERDNIKRLAGMEKVARQQENQIRQLKVQAAQKAEAIKRKTEECQRLREKQRHVEVGGGRRANLNQTTTLAPLNSMNTTVVLNGRTLFTPVRNPRLSSLNKTFVTASPVAAKKQFTTMEKMLNRIITQRQTISKMEEEMDRQVKERQLLQEELLKLDSTPFNTMDEKVVLKEQKQSINDKLKYVQDQIMNLQKSIMDVGCIAAGENENEENEAEADDQTNLTSLADQCSNVMDAKYIILRLLNMVVDKGVATCKAQYEKKELAARIQQLQSQSKISEQLMSQLIESDKHITSDINELVDARKSDSPPEDRHRFQLPSGELPTNNSACSSQISSDKVRRRTATTEELLYVSSLLSSPVKQSIESLKAIPEIATTSECSNTEELALQNIDEAMKKSTNSSNFCDEEELSSQADAPPSSRSKRRISEITRYVPGPKTGEVAPKCGLLCRSHTAEGHSRRVNCVHASETNLLSGSWDRTAKLWDLEKCQEVLSLHGHMNHVNFVHILPEDRHLAISGSLYVAKVWDLRTGQCVRHLQSSGLVSEGENQRIPRVNEVPLQESIIYACAVDNSHKYMFTTSRNDIRVWNLENLSSVMLLSGNHTEELSCLAVSNQPNNIIRVVAGSRDCKVGIYDFSPLTGAASSRNTLNPAHKQLVSAALCHGDSLFSASRDKDIMHFSLRDFKRNHIENNAHNKAVSAMCLLKSHSDNDHQQNVYLTTVCREGTMKFWDISSSNRMRLADTIHNAHSKGIKDVCSNSQLLFTASDDDTIGFWHIL